MTQRSEPAAAARDFPARVSDHAVADRYDAPWSGPGAQWTQLILEDLDALGDDARPTVVDIGCGGGLMGEPLWQALIAERAGPYIGIEPAADTAWQQETSPDAPAAAGAGAGAVFTVRVGATFEEAPLAPASVDLAYAAMVLEHIADPVAFFGKLAEVIRPGGVFWGFTVDRRHYFSWLSQLMGRVRLKDRYLDRVRGRRGESAGRYDNYPTHYLCNSPSALATIAAPAFTLQTWSLHRVGQLDGYVPWRLRGLSRRLDRLVLRAHLPGSVLVVRLVRR